MSNFWSSWCTMKSNLVGTLLGATAFRNEIKRNEHDNVGGDRNSTSSPTNLRIHIRFGYCVRTTGELTGPCARTIGSANTDVTTAAWININTLQTTLSGLHSEKTAARSGSAEAI